MYTSCYKTVFLAVTIVALVSSAVSADLGSLESRSYQTAAGATMQEFTEPPPAQPRTVPFAATVTFDLESEPPSLTATIHNAILERGEPFSLTVKSRTFYKLSDGSYRFDGYFIPDSQYLFSWIFSTNANGRILWNGQAFWAGGHIWELGISDVPIDPVAKLDVEMAGGQIIVSWATADTGYRLEQTANLESPAWSLIDQIPEIVGTRFTVSLDNSTATFFRLRRP